MFQNYETSIFARLWFSAWIAFFGFGGSAIIVIVPARIMGYHARDIENVVFWISLCIGLLLAILYFVGGSDAANEPKVEPTRTYPKNRKKSQLSENKKKIKHLKEELESEKAISELEQELMAERRLREKYKKMALSDD